MNRFPRFIGDAQISRFVLHKLAWLAKLHIRRVEIANANQANKREHGSIGPIQRKRPPIGSKAKEQQKRQSSNLHMAEYYGRAS